MMAMAAERLSLLSENVIVQPFIVGDWVFASQHRPSRHLSATCRRYYRHQARTRKANSNEQTRPLTQRARCWTLLPEEACPKVLSGERSGFHTCGMLMALLFGAVASSALLVGAFIGVRFELPKRLLAILLSFAAGALITALAFELFEDAYEKGGIERAAIGLFTGAIVFTGLSALLDRWAQPGKKSIPTSEIQGSPKLDTDAAASDRPPTPASTRGAAGMALLAAVTLDGIPENVALGVALGEGTGGLALLAAIFVSNLPEALVGAASMRTQGKSGAVIIGLWSACAVLLVLAVVVGVGPLSGSDPATISLPLAFAAGAVIASLADTLMPEAYEHGGPAVALSTAAGFVLSFVLSLA
jgi:ZIP family zinc transporter